VARGFVVHKRRRLVRLRGTLGRHFGSPPRPLNPHVRGAHLLDGRPQPVITMGLEIAPTLRQLAGALFRLANALPGLRPAALDAVGGILAMLVSVDVVVSGDPWSMSGSSGASGCRGCPPHTCLFPLTEPERAFSAAT